MVDEMAFDLAGKLGRQLDKQQIENDMVCPEGVSSPLVTAFQSELLLEGFPSLSPHAIPAVPTFHCVPDSNIQKTTVEDRQKSDTSASFDYSDIENCHFNQPPSTSGEEEFEFPPPLTTSTVKSGGIYCVSQSYVRCSLYSLVFYVWLSFLSMYR